ncbi:ribosome maturation factor RimM [Phytohalomonas tamaricis]|uniref:ribosome maturation factor RimM n=1 Tax=Phytohalomonas tamaricis TaxID=2081032 RepID=UPI000D0B2FCE|nr:ribosome maturation factor RimM [Phytohalomonas tamaricis]
MSETHASDRPAGDYVVMGKLTSPYGVKGWLKVYSYTSPMDGILEYSEWLIELQGKRFPLQLVQGRRQGKGLVAQFKDIDSREAAESLAGGTIYLATRELPTLGRDEYYWYQLEGLKVVTLDGIRLGHVGYLFETGANDVLVVKGDDASLDQKERLLPFLPGEVIHDVNLDTGIMTVNWDPEF